MSEEKHIRMSVPYFQVPNDIFDKKIMVREQKTEEIRPLRTSEKIVYIYLCRCGNQGAKAFPSYNDIANKCGVSRRKAIDAVTVLEENGLLLKEIRPKSNNDNYSNVYEVINPSAIDAPGSEMIALASAIDAPYKELLKKNQIKRSNIYNGDFASESHDMIISFNDFKYNRNIYDEDTVLYIEYYLRKYKEYMGNNHPKLKVYQWNNVVDSILNCYDEYLGKAFDLDYEIIRYMIDKHFKTNYSGRCDYNILHFIQDGILCNRYYEVKRECDDLY